MTAAQADELLAFWRIERCGQDREDVRWAVLASLVAGPWLKKGKKLEAQDLLDMLTGDKKAPKNLKAKIMAALGQEAQLRKM